MGLERLSKSRHFFLQHSNMKDVWKDNIPSLLHFWGKKTATMYNLIWGGYPLQRDKKQRQLLHEAGKTIVLCNLKLPLEDSKMLKNMFRNLTSQNAIIQYF